MSERAASLKIIESRILLVMLVFSFISGFQALFRIHLYLILGDLGYSVREISLIYSSLNHALYIINPILLFIVLFFTCNKDLLMKIASSIISLILGSLVGYWLGALCATATLTISYPEIWASSLSILSHSLYSASTYNMLIGFAAVASAAIIARWKASLLKSNLILEKPSGIVVLSAIYIIFGVLITFIFPLILLYPLLADIFFTKLFLAIILVLVLTLGGLSQIVIGIGLYMGRKWGWIPAFISVVTSILVSIQELTLYKYFGMLGVSILAIALFLSVIIAVYLLQPHVRSHFGLVNPPTSSEKQSLASQS